MVTQHRDRAQTPLTLKVVGYHYYLLYLFYPEEILNPDLFDIYSSALN